MLKWHRLLYASCVFTNTLSSLDLLIINWMIVDDWLNSELWLYVECAIPFQIFNGRENRNRLNNYECSVYWCDSVAHRYTFVIRLRYRGAARPTNFIFCLHDWHCVVWLACCSFECSLGRRYKCKTCNICAVWILRIFYNSVFYKCVAFILIFQATFPPNYQIQF